MIFISHNSNFNKQICSTRLTCFVFRDDFRIIIFCQSTLADNVVIFTLSRMSNLLIDYAHFRRYINYKDRNKVYVAGIGWGVHIVPADALAVNATRASAGMMMTLCKQIFWIRKTVKQTRITNKRNSNPCKHNMLLCASIGQVPARCWHMPACFLG